MTGPAVGPCQGLVERLNHLVDDVDVRGGQGRHQDRMAALGGHAPEGGRGGAPGEGGEMPAPLRGHGAEVEAVRPESSQVDELGHLRFDLFR